MVTPAISNAEVNRILFLAGRAHAVQSIPAVLCPSPIWTARALLVICRVDRQRQLQVDLAQHAPEVLA